MAHAAPAGYGTTLLVVTWVEAAIAFLLLLARVYTTWRITRHVRSDLFLTLLTFAVAMASTIFLTVSINYGLGEHVDADTLLPEQISAAIKWSWINQALGIFAIALGKLAIVAFLQQIHGPEHRGRVLMLWGVAISNLLINSITIGMIYTQCSPRRRLWNDAIPGSCDGRRRNQTTAYFQGSWSVFCDLILALYPVAFFWKVRLSMRIKVGLCLLMGLGIIACACSVVKTTYLRVLSQTQDVTYYIAQLVTWNETEKWVVLIVGCIPPIRPLLMVLFHKVVTSVRSSSGHNKHHKETELHSYSQISSPAVRSRSDTARLPSVLSAKRSEDNALEEGAIMRTTDIILSYEVASAPRTPHAPSDNRLVTPHENI